jgi:ribosomal protein S18 acetylase RimI-like enzyme
MNAGMGMAPPLYKGGAAVRPLGAHEWALYRTLRLRSLLDAPEAFCATLAEAELRTDDDWAWIVKLGATSGRDRPLVAQLDGTPLGLAWARVDADDPGVVNLFQVWVAPEARGHGVAAALLDAALGWARSRGARAMQLGVVCGNDAARRLYERAGFRNAGAPEPQHPGASRMEQKMRLDLTGSAA